MRRQFRHFLAVAALQLSFGGCGPGRPETGPEGVTCSSLSKCPHGYKCSNNPADPHSTGECKYQECGLTDICNKPQACIPNQTAMCDRFNNDKFCECEGLNSENVPNPPATGGDPTTGKP
jgi:hypothetical protein